LGSTSQYHEGFDHHVNHFTSNEDDDTIVLGEDVKRSRLYPKYLQLMETICNYDDLDDVDEALDLLLLKRTTSKKRKEALDVFNEDGAVGRLEKRHRRHYEHKA
jgi:hypothetical protein